MTVLHESVLGLSMTAPPLNGGGPVYGAEWWDAASAVGTVGATLVALTLAFISWKKQRSAARDEELRAAKLVSSWAETDYVPNQERDAYVLRASVLLANESDRPVFGVHVTVGVRLRAAGDVVSLGSVSMPEVVWTLPSRHRREWDVTMGLLAMTSADQVGRLEPLCKVAFSDGDGTRWLRDWDGATSRVVVDPRRPTTLLDVGSEDAEQQLGPLDNLFNPMATALDFQNALELESDDETLAAIRPLLQEGQFGEWGHEDLEELRSMFADKGVASNIRYLAPRVCYALFMTEEEAKQPVRSSGLMEVMAQFVTMLWIPRTGWRICAIGGSTVRPDWLRFPPGAITDDPRAVVSGGRSSESDGGAE